MLTCTILFLRSVLGNVFIVHADCEQNEGNPDKDKDEAIEPHELGDGERPFPLYVHE